MKKYRPWLAKRMWRLWRAAVQWQAHDGNVLSAATAYYAVVSLMPLLLILVSLLGFVFEVSAEAKSAQDELIRIVANRTSPAIADWLDGILRDVREGAPVIGPLGFAMLLLAAVGVFAQFEHAFNTIWHVKCHESQGIAGAIRNALWQRFRAFAMLTVLGLAVVSMALVGLVLAMLKPDADAFPGAGWVGSLVQLPLGLLLNWLVFTLLYKLVPRIPVRWPEAAGGALLSSILWEVARHALALGLRASRYGAYGVIGALIIFMLWIYAGAAIIFMGAEYTHVLGRDHRGRH